jgi:hypothetical protein
MNTGKTETKQPEQTAKKKNYTLCYVALEQHDTLKDAAAHLSATVTNLLRNTKNAELVAGPVFCSGVILQAVLSDSEMTQ